MECYSKESYFRIDKDMELIESLWKQNVDLGFSLEVAKKEFDNGLKLGFESFAQEDSIDTETTSLPLKEEVKVEPKDEKKDEEKEEKDIWAGLDYTVDTETGEYVMIKEEHTHADPKPGVVEELLNLPEYFLEEALSLVDNYGQALQHVLNNSVPKSLTDEDALLGNHPSEVVQWQCHQPAQIISFIPEEQLIFSPPPYIYPSVNSEQRWLETPDIPISYSVHPPPQVPSHQFVSPTSSYYKVPTSTPEPCQANEKTTGNVLAESMNLTTDNESTKNYSELLMNSSDSSCLATLLTDEDLELMNMAMNEGMYTMRSFEAQDPRNFTPSFNTSPLTTSNTTNHRERTGSSNDSAVSSMGSERIPNLSDSEWCDAASKRLVSGETSLNSSPTHVSPTAQNEHQTIEKRYFQMQMDSSQQDHQLPNEQFKKALHELHSFRKKSKSSRFSQEHLSRDEKRAKAMNIPMTVEEIINLPMDEFNERISKTELSENQLSLIRDIRRRGKNKVAAQNCRKRKLDQILHLADEVKEMRDRKLKLENDHANAVSNVKRMREKLQQLYRHVFRNLRDVHGNPYSPYEYSLQTTADGSMVMVPKSLQNQL